MSENKKRKLETLEVQSKKKKSIVVVVAIISLIAIIFTSLGNAYLSVDKSKIYEKRNIDKMSDMEVIKNPEYKENWAISIENRLKSQESRTTELIDLVKNQQDSVISNLKTFINENNKDLTTQLTLFKDQENAKYQDLKSFIEKRLQENSDRIDQVEKLAQQQKKYVPTDNNIGEDLVLGKDMLPTKKSVEDLEKDIKDQNLSESEINEKLKKIIESIEDPILKETLLKDPKLSAADKIDFIKNSISEDIKEENATNSNDTIEPIEVAEPEKTAKLNLVTVDIDTSFNDNLIKAQASIDKEIQNKSKKETVLSPYHISTGYTQAYMITGAYAPAFQEGSMEPLPVLFEAEGDIIMANDTLGTLDKCFLLGSAKGNMNSETADIKLVSISCLINGGTHRIEGSISGWVIGENGTPGLQGEMLHKNGAWLARTFVSGFFETFSAALSGGQTQPINIGADTGTGTATVSTNSAINSNLLSAGASGISNVFSKLGEYYLKMAEQIFPIIEVKGGRTVNILLIGGEDLTVVENNLVSTKDMSDKASDIQLEKEEKNGNIQYTNAFTKVISESSASSSSNNVPAFEAEPKTEDSFSSIPEPIN